MDRRREPHPAAVLRCAVCGRTQDCSEADVNNYILTDAWPRCCEEIMAVFVATAYPGNPPSRPDKT